MLTFGRTKARDEIEISETNLFAAVFSRTTGEINPHNN